VEFEMDRKKFFNSLGISIAGLLILKFAPFRFLRDKGKRKKVLVKINPLAIKRKKTGRNNVQ